MKYAYAQGFPPYKMLVELLNQNTKLIPMQ